jgi:glycosyltransferase involved in cell wall biosynthesis
VLFLGERDEVEQILPAFEVFALSSLAEGVPLTILEAMAVGVPIVSTAVGGIPEVLVDGEEARLVSIDVPDPIGAFTAALKSVLLDQNLRASFRTQALARVKKEFSSEAMLERYRALYCETVEDLKHKGIRVADRREPQEFGSQSHK